MGCPLNIFQKCPIRNYTTKIVSPIRVLLEWVGEYEIDFIRTFQGTKHYPDTKEA